MHPVAVSFAENLIIFYAGSHLEQMLNCNSPQLLAAKKRTVICKKINKLVLNGKQSLLHSKANRHANHTFGKRKLHVRVGSRVGFKASLGNQLAVAQHRHTVHMNGFAIVQSTEKAIQPRAFHSLCLRCAGFQSV